MTAQITILSPDMIAHLGGCADITRRGKFNRSVNPGERAHANEYTGATLVDAINEANEDMASWFGEEAYTQSSRDNGCWTVGTCEVEPCLVKAFKDAGIEFDENGRPSVKAAKKVAPAKRRTTKVWMAVSVEIDVDALEAEYGRSFTIAEAKQDVKDSIPSVLAQVLYPEDSKVVLNVSAK